MTSSHNGNSPVLHAVMRDRLLAETRTALTVLRDGDAVSVRSVAESHLPMYAAAIVAVMAEHRPDVDGNCSACVRHGRWPWSRRVHAPCKAMIAINYAMSQPMVVLAAHLARPGRADLAPEVRASAR